MNQDKDGKSFRVFFGNVEIDDNLNISFKKSRKQISFSWDPDDNELYSLILYSPPSNVKYFSVNISRADLDYSDEIIEFHPNNLNPGKYVVGLYLQEESTLERFDDYNIKNIFDFLKNLELVKNIHFTIFVNNSDDEEKDDQGGKWCRCVLHVASKQNKECLENPAKNARKKIGGQICYNPYAVCTKSTGESPKKCGDSYVFEKLSDDEIKAYAHLKHIKIHVPFRRSKAISAIKKWKKGES